MSDIHLTAEGLAKIKVELEELRGPSREELAARLRSAIQMGDLSENADNHKSKGMVLVPLPGCSIVNWR